MPPSTGTIRIVPKQVMTVTGSWSEGPITAFPACGNELPAMSDPDIAAYLNEDGGVSADAPLARQTNEAFCAPDCFGVYPPAGPYGMIMSPATDEIIFNPGGSQEVLDILSSTFPMGILITALRVQFVGSANPGIGQPGPDIENFNLYWGNTVVWSDATPNIGGSQSSDSDAIIPADTHQGLLTALTFFGFDVDVVNNSVIATGCGNIDVAFCNLLVRNLRLTMSYITWSANIALTPEVTTRRALPDTIFTLTADDDLEQLEELNAYPVNDDGTLGSPILLTILTQTPTQITFTIPDTAETELAIFGEGDGTEFTGQVQLGVVRLVNGAGLYQLVPGKRNDTYYDRSETPATTIDIKIPDPTARTGYL